MSRSCEGPANGEPPGAEPGRGRLQACLKIPRALVSKRRGEAAREDLKTQRPPGSDWWPEARRSAALKAQAGRVPCTKEARESRRGIVEGRPSHTPKLNSNNNKNSNRSSGSNHFAGSPQTRLPSGGEADGGCSFCGNLAAEANGSNPANPGAPEGDLPRRLCAEAPLLSQPRGPPAGAPSCLPAERLPRSPGRAASPLLSSPGQGLGWAGGQPRGLRSAARLRHPRGGWKGRGAELSPKLPFSGTRPGRLDSPIRRAANNRAGKAA